jgi:hypothetical protein
MGLAARGGEKTTHRPRLELQIKCTHIDDGDENELPYDLKIKNYDDLRADTIVPRILVVVLVPEDLGSWISLSADQMCLHYCAYWMSLAGYSETANHETVRVRLSRLSNFSPSVLQAIMERINRGEMP